MTRRTQDGTLAHNFQNIIPEILSQIFVACLPVRNEYPPDPRRCVLLKLGLVCSYWYQVSLSTEELWCGFGIEMTFRNYSPGNDAKYAKAAKLFTSRSGNRPLSIKYDCVKAAPLVIQALISCQSRWGTLWLSGYPEGFGLLLQSVETRGGQSLKTLKIHIPNNHGALTMMVDNIPGLAHVDLRGPVYLLAPLSAPLHTLQSLRLTHHWLHSVDSYLKWVELSPQLRHLRLEFVDFNFRVHPGRRETEIQHHLVNLISLVLDCNVDLDNEPAKLFLSHITAPALESLQLNLTSSQSHNSGFDSETRNIGGFGLDLIDFLRRSSPALKKMVIGSSFVKSNDLLNRIIPWVPMLEELTLWQDLATDEVLQALSSDTVGNLCPKLRRLVLHILPVGDNLLSRTVLAEFISKRCTMDRILLHKAKEEICFKEIILLESTFKQQEEEYLHGQARDFSNIDSMIDTRPCDKFRSLCEHELVQQAVEQGFRVFVSISILFMLSSF